MIPAFDRRGNLPPGIHTASWGELARRYGTTRHRLKLLSGLEAACRELRRAGCQRVYVDGSFVTAKTVPADFDGCWSVTETDLSKLDPVLLDLSNGRAAQKAKYFGELFPAELPEGATGKSFLEFFQRDRQTREAKGLVELRLEAMP
ncbi:MAG: hypothetical protein HY816_20890 [Candidatus Wallbacteria bacterium]|nr:hypothetical protein [Candidatus Wallbacteria bacterium]